MDKKLKDKLENLKERYKELQNLLAQNEVIQDIERLTQYAKEFNEIKEKVELFLELESIDKQINELEGVLKEKHDPEFLKLVDQECNQLKQRYRDLEEKITSSLTLPQNDKDIIMEIRAGTGGLEASLFAADLYRMYTKYATKKGWQIEPIYAHPTELGGFKEIIFGIRGKGAYSKLRFESGVHRVQRVPTTEASGRIHTSTATVAVLEEPKEVDLVIDPKELRIDVFRSSGPGGQGVNTTDSAVRITHLPTGIIVTCQDERSQLKNKQKALRVLRARLLEIKKKEQLDKISHLRKSQIGTGERSEKIRTYNFPDRRVTDHRVGLTIYRLEEILEGDLDELLEGLDSLQKE
ncbi:MAG: peptide chain release factor 1 [Candidatus Omnitrophica bacterium]|nr:peptide chain release factor 1 [Candidatus Omnitrophota bacterium]MCM8799390.1 peptide chain release factor 1 [Candidatus Omnitrophota bacterium]